MALAPAKTLVSVCANASFTNVYLSVLAITTALGLNFMACSIKRSQLLLATNISAEKISGLPSITSSACVPIDPVEPNIAMFFTVETYSGIN